MNNNHPLDLLINANDYPSLYKIFKNTSRRVAMKGEYLFRQGDVPNQLAVTTSGTLEISYIDEDGNYVIIEKCNEGFWFGDAAFIDGGALPYSALALEDTSFISISHKEINSFPQLQHELFKFISHTVVARLRIMYQKFDSLATKPLEERLVDRLKQLQYKNDDIAISHDDLAYYLGVSRHKVSRAMKRLSTQGVIKQKYKKVLLLK
ncbi:Crp/Fnr family transcriptional regulator [Aliivibrio finisterrensis]|uniref:Crp/Fnr family transcriptional regulator n=1 Tax=Aliivibrio finisterrensis TaxID=511998 RepID=UPI0010224FDC|nr:Crp/Fnr family transcriptional regulator [Aliivibrio finisterrensis]RYU70567.1 Crp/Fnr family transcriptional regulator [Aliivibrio finisterrensis]RYU74429.1 Crp/Fnr family transcriptional regulator [Aliivibrio finisterrensis]RYU77035.1 Crp/Fnr family transcriptional regulator [Aliivibrio finisterrensis]